MKAFIEFIYSVLIGLAVAFFIGFGLWSFLSTPKYPDSPEYIQYPTAPTYQAYLYSYEEQQAYTQKQKAYEQELQTYNEKSAQQGQEFQAKLDEYNKADKSFKNKTAIIAALCGVLSYITGILVFRKNAVIAEGMALGGIFTGVYAAAIGLGIDSKKLVFGITTGLLAMLILLVLQRTRLKQVR
jgi:hypothetical protein